MELYIPRRGICAAGQNLAAKEGHGDSKKNPYTCFPFHRTRGGRYTSSDSLLDGRDRDERKAMSSRVAGGQARGVTRADLLRLRRPLFIPQRQSIFVRNTENEREERHHD